MSIKPKLKIAMVANVIERVPPKKYGGTERVVYWLTEELVKRGHMVTLFASGDSITSANLISVFPKAIREAKLKNIYGGNNWTLLNIATAYNLQDQFDIIHDHIGELSIPTANNSKTPVVMTIHGAFNLDNKQLYESASNINFVTISKSQAQPLPYLNYIDTVYNGLGLKDYPFSSKPGKYLLYVGRISSEKGVHKAIEVAKYLNLPLIIAAKLDSTVPGDLSYFKQYIKPNLSDQIKWIGEVDEKERNQLMKNAYAFLHPVSWREPFGLTLIESMACGTPVVAFQMGSIPEVIEHGVTGFIVNDVESMALAIQYVKYLDRALCRKRALENFSAQKMADRYEDVYYKVLSSNRTEELVKSFISTRLPEIISHSKPVVDQAYFHDLSDRREEKLKS